MLISETPHPPCGWNSYDCFLGSISEKQALDNLECFIKQLKPHGYEYFCLDAGWYADDDMVTHYALRREGQFRKMHIDSFGRYISSPERFPRGVEYISRMCHENGIKFGVHMMRGMPLGALQKNTPIKGTNFRARDIYDPDNACQWCQYWVAAKAGHPGTLAFYKSEVEYLANVLEVDFIKLDDVTEHPDHVELFAEAIDSVDRPILFSLSPGNETCPENWKIFEKYANMVRITADIWDKDASNLQKLQKWYEFQNAGSEKCYLDLDMLPLGMLLSGLPQDYDGSKSIGEHQSLLSPRGKRGLMTIAALSKSPLIFGGDLTATPAEDIAYATHPEVLACNRRGTFARRVSFIRHIDIRKSEDRNDPGHGWIGVFSVSDLNRKVTLTPELLGFDRMPELYDIWNGYTLHPEADGRIEVFMEMKDTLFLKY